MKSLTDPHWGFFLKHNSVCLSSESITHMPAHTPGKVWACSWWEGWGHPQGYPPRPELGHQWAPGLSQCLVVLDALIKSNRCSSGLRSGERVGPDNYMSTFAIWQWSALSGRMRRSTVLHQGEPSVNASISTSALLVMTRRPEQEHACHDHHWATTKLVMLDGVTGSVSYLFSVEQTESRRWTCPLCCYLV